MKTSTPALPSAIARYLAAANRHDPQAAAACFTADAIVQDENQRHLGRATIRQWLEGTSQKYRPAYTLMRAAVRGNEISLSVTVAGQFPGSPVTLDYELQLRRGKIAALTIA